jgi:L-threonylcarbamoyladenylate synthase
LNENAVVKIYEAKDRPRFNPMIVHIYDADELNKYGDEIPQDVYKLSEKFSPGPITYIVRKKNIIPDIVTSGNDSVGLRIPAHNSFREVIKLSGVPIAAPSANRSGMISPTSAEDVLKELSGKANYILDGGKCEIGIESTVISFLNNDVKILRHGFVTKEEIEKVIGKIPDNKSDSKSDKIISPGLLKSHYAPKTPFYIAQNSEEVKRLTSGKTGFMDFSKFKNKKEIALKLFSEMRKLDEQAFEMIVGEKVDDTGLGTAINDRLERASSGTIEIKNGKTFIKNN